MIKNLTVLSLLLNVQTFSCITSVQKTEEYRL